jgi:crotonobetainyl-CoA:carnitine CoA-transferase CaiB-like acyl-CoA transferase
VFLCNTLPKRYKQLGIDYQTLQEANPDLIWCGISALGPEHPETAGYDPALQALLGYMYLTGEPDRDPMLCGLPIIDLKAGDEAFTQVLLAMMDQNSAVQRGDAGPHGREIHISMAQCAASWLITALPQLEFVHDESRQFTRSGNEHRSFIPCNCYPTKDGFVYLAIGSDSQWAKLTSLTHFEHLDRPNWKTNQGRGEEKDAIYAGIGASLTHYTTEAFIALCLEHNLSVAPVNSIRDTAKLDYVRRAMVQTELPSGTKRSMFPAPFITDFLLQQGMTLRCAPRLGEHNRNVYGEIGLGDEDIRTLRECEVI